MPGGLDQFLLDDLGAEVAIVGLVVAPALEFALCLGLYPHQISDLDQLLRQKPDPRLELR
jgi:hypothetical protein